MANLTIILAVIFFGGMLFCFIHEMFFKEFECKDCSATVKAYELKQLESYNDVREFVDHGGTDPYYYMKKTKVYKCPKCSKDIAVERR